MVEMRFAPLVKGVLTFVPGLADLLPSRGAEKHQPASYWYSVWMKHLTLLNAHGMEQIPDVVAELGPGDSIGVGIAALLSGSHHYVGVDVAVHSNTAHNLVLLDELVALFRRRAGRPDNGWPNFNAYLDETSFPSRALTPTLLEASLADERIELIRSAIVGGNDAATITARYRAPWSDPRVIAANSIDLLVSHSVLEHVVDLESTYRALYQWLKPGGWMSHQIDFRSHGLSRHWNGYRACSDLVWKMALGRRMYMINRCPASEHLRLIERAGFQIVTQLKHMRDDGVRRDALAPRWNDISDEDLACSGLYVIARK